ncbi:hypothetical protein QZH41_006874 [Actinostola sp. cb2023]|nr:hypothetical protein QZH41_006874 [Actinostola sp. cb2023]
MNNTTSTSNGDQTVPSQSEAQRIFKIVFYILLFIVGTIGNFLVVIIIKAKQRQRTVNDYFILNLAVSDLTFLCFALPFYYYELFERFTKFQFYCKFVWPMMSVSLFVSVFTLTLMAVERCRAILFPFRPRIKIPTLLLGIISAWILAILCIVPLMIVSNAEGVLCIEKWPKDAHRKAYTAVLFVLQFAIPICVIAIAYITIVIALFTTKVPDRTSINHRGQVVKQSRSRSDNIHIIRTVAIIIALFVICMLPNQMAWILTDFGGKQYQNLSEKFWLFAEALMFFHSCVNPIIYGSLTRQFRQGYIKYINFVCCCVRANQNAVHLTEQQRNITKTRGPHHGRQVYQGSLMSPMSVNGVRTSYQLPTVVTSYRNVTSRSPPSPARLSPNPARLPPSSSRLPPSSSRLPPSPSRLPPSPTQPKSSRVRPPSSLIIDNKMATIDGEMSSVAISNIYKETKVNQDEILSTTRNVVRGNFFYVLGVRGKYDEQDEMLQENRDDSRERQMATEILHDEMKQQVAENVLESTVLANPLAHDTGRNMSEKMLTKEDENTDEVVQTRDNKPTYLQLGISQSELGFITGKMEEDSWRSYTSDGCPGSSINYGIGHDDDDEPAVQDTYL